jgi:hypothetical protein
MVYMIVLKLTYTKYGFRLQITQITQMGVSIVKGCLIERHKSNKKEGGRAEQKMVWY